MNSPIDTTPSQRAVITVAPATQKLIQRWMAHALAGLHMPASTLVEGHIALMTLDSKDSANVDFPATTCTLHWQHEQWVLASFSSLSLVEDNSPPLTEFAFWFSPPQPVGYRLQWGQMRHEEALLALQAWEAQLVARHDANTLAVTVTLNVPYLGEREVHVIPA